MRIRPPMVVAAGVLLASTSWPQTSERDLSPSVRVTPDGRAYVSGSTTSTDFPVSPGDFDTTHSGTNDAWVAKLKPDGSGIEWGTYLGGRCRAALPRTR